MKSKNMTLMAIAIGCGLVAAVLTAKLSGGGGPQMVEVVIAKKELPVGTILDEKDFDALLGSAKFPKETLPPDIITNIDDLKGKRMNRTMGAGKFFTAGDVAVDSGITLPAGMGKYAIRTDGVKAVAGFVQPGDHVDVQLTEQLPNGKVRAGFVLRDMLVLAVDNGITRRDNGAAVLTVNSVSLAVTPVDSLYLSAAEKRGEVKLVLKDPNDKDTREVPPITIIPGIDQKDKANVPVATAPKTVAVVVAKTEVPVNTLITNDNFDNYFVMKDLPEELVTGKAIKDRESLRGKYVTNKLEADMMVFGSWLSDNKLVTEPPVVAKVESELLPVQPREKEIEKPLYPRRFEQIINSQRVWFIEEKPGEFRRAEAADVRDLPNTNGGAEKKEEKKPDDARGDRPV